MSHSAAASASFPLPKSSSFAGPPLPPKINTPLKIQPANALRSESAFHVNSQDHNVYNVNNNMNFNHTLPPKSQPNYGYSTLPANFGMPKSNSSNNMSKSNSSSQLAKLENISFGSHVPALPPVTKAGTVLRRTGITRAWKERQMLLDANNVGILTFPEANTKLILHGRFVHAYVEVMWVWEEKTGQRHRFSITTGNKHTEVVETNSVSELEAWMLALQSHGCDINRPIRAGPLSISLGDFWFVLYPDGLRWLKKKSEVKVVGVVPIGEGSVFERQANGSFMLEETGDEHAKCILATAAPEEAFGWCEDIERVVNARHKKRCADSLQEGYLFTCGAKHGNWKKRFCVIRESEMVIYKKRFDELRAVTIRLPPGADAESMQETGDKFPFWVAETGDDVGTQRHFFSPKTSDMRDVWLHTFQTLFNSKNNNVYEHSLKEGYLYKQNAADGVWVKKYFVLQKDTFLYATKRKHSAPDKVLDLNHGFEYALLSQSAADPQRNKPGMLTVAENGDEQGTRTYILHAKDNSTRAAWLQAFANVLKGKDTRVNPNSLREGYMRKQKKDKSKWSKCYFILTQTSLSYYRRRNDKSAAGEFPIQGCTEVARVEGEEGENRWQFSLADSGDESAKTYYFSLPTAEIRTQWVNTLLKLIRSKDSKVHKGSSLEGYLWKYDASNVGKKLYFVLTDNVLSYYKRRLDSNPVSRLVVQGEAEIHYLADDQIPFAFSVAKTGDEGETVLKICASDSATCSEWVHQLRLQASRFTTKEDPDSIRENYVYLLQGKEWHKRYYILDTQCLSIYTKRKDQKPFMKFVLDKETIVVLLDGSKPPLHGSVWGTHIDEKTDTVSGTTGGSFSFSGEDCKKDEIQIVLCESGDPSAKNIRLKGFNESEAILTADLMELCLRIEFLTNESTQLCKSGHILVQYKNRAVPSFVELTPERLTYVDPAAICNNKTTLEIGQGFQTSYSGLSIRVMDRKEKEVVIAIQSEEEKKNWAATLELFLLSKDSKRQWLFGGGLATTFVNSPYYRQPSIISRCVEYLKQCPTSVCLLSSPGFHPLIRSFIQDFENGVDVTLTDPKSVVACLKVYLVMLEQPLISNTQVKDFAKVLGDTSPVNGLWAQEASREQLSALRKVLQGMDVQYRISLSIILFYLLGEINRPEEVEVTLAQVVFTWAPILMRCKPEQGATDDVRYSVLNGLLRNLQTLFPSGAPIAVRRLPVQQLQELKAQAKSISFDVLRKDKLGFALLTEWCKDNFVEENMLFLLALDRYRYLCSFPLVSQQERLEVAKQICDIHIKKDAEMQLNISSELAGSVLARFESASEKKTDILSGEEFTAVEAEVHVLIATNEFARFRTAEAYDTWIAHRHAMEKPTVTQSLPLLLSSPLTSQSSVLSSSVPSLFQPAVASPSPSLSSPSFSSFSSQSLTSQSSLSQSFPAQPSFQSLPSLMPSFPSNAHSFQTISSKASPPLAQPFPQTHIVVPLAPVQNAPPSYAQAMGAPMVAPPSYSQSLSMHAHVPAPRMNIVVNTPHSYMARTMGPSEFPSKNLPRSSSTLGSEVRGPQIEG